MRVVEIKPEWMDWPTLQSFYGNTILTFVNTRVCSLVYSFAVCLNNGGGLEQTIQPRDLCHVPRLLPHGRL